MRLDYQILLKSHPLTSLAGSALGETVFVYSEKAHSFKLYEKAWVNLEQCFHKFEKSNVSARL